MFVILSTVMTYMQKNKNLLNNLWYIYTVVYIYLKGWRPINIAIKVLQHILVSPLKGSYIITCAKLIVVTASSEDIRMTTGGDKRGLQLYV